MKQNVFPLINEITIDSIADHCKAEFGIKKGDFEHIIFNAGGWLSRIRRGISKMNDYHYQEMFKLLKSESGSDSDSFVAVMKNWYPALKKYTNAADVIAVIRANLEGIAWDGAQSLAGSGNNLSSKQFLETCLTYNSAIKCIKTAAQTGWRWFDDHERTNLLTQLAQKEIMIQVIANPSFPVMEKIARAMSDPSKKLRYMGFNNTLAKWHDYEKTYPYIKFRVSEYPILRQTLIVEFEDNSSRGLVRDYVYGLPVERSSPCKQVFDSEPDFNYYYSEFKFLWDNAQTYEQWHDTLPEPKETLQSGNYILVYPSQRRTPKNHPKWIYSSLSILDNNTASLKVNIADPFDVIESHNYCEYSYQGSLRLTRNSIFLSLYDNGQQEEINISLVRPLHAKERFIGIMTALSPSGQQPVAFKCACIDRSILPKLNFRVLNKLLSHDNKDWGESLLIIENQDINLFYSDLILTDKF